MDLDQYRMSRYIWLRRFIYWLQSFRALQKVTVVFPIKKAYRILYTRHSQHSQHCASMQELITDIKNTIGVQGRLLVYAFSLGYLDDDFWNVLSASHRKWDEVDLWGRSSNSLNSLHTEYEGNVYGLVNFLSHLSLLAL